MSFIDTPIQKRKYTPRYSNGNPIWRYFTIPPYSKFPSCNICGIIIMNGWKSIAGNTTNMRNHLKKRHPQLFEELCLLCENEQRKQNPVNWKIIPYISRSEFLEKILPKPDLEPESEDEFPSYYNTPERPNTPPSTYSTPPNSSPQRESTTSLNPRFSKEELEFEEASLRLELLRSQIRREVAAAEFYRAQTRAIKEGRFPFIPQSPPQ